MKKLVLLLVTAACMYACSETTDLADLSVSNSGAEQLSEKQSRTSPLLEDDNFASAYYEAADYLATSRGELSNQVNLKSLNHRNGMLYITSEKEFRPVYEQVREKDSIWQTTYDDQIEQLIGIAQENPEFAKQYTYDELSIEIEDLFETDQIGFYDLQQSISDRMPINTLWSKIKQENDEWVINATQESNWEENPAEQYGIETYAQLFINAETAINILDTTRHITGVVSFEDEEQTEGRGGAGCRTFRMRTEFTDNTGHPTCLRMRCYINNFWLWRSFGVNTKGWRWINGRWRERRFQKSLARGGFVVMHQLQLQNPCDPAFAQGVGWTTVRNNVEFSINSTIWNAYAGACINNFGGSVLGGGRFQDAIMN